MTKSKHSTASDTAIAKTSRWLRLSAHRDEIDQLFDLYWGGKERRITRLTLKIMGINIIVLFALLIGVIYLSQYQEKLITSKLEVFQTEIYLLSAALTEGAAHTENGQVKALDPVRVQDLSTRLAPGIGKKIMVFGPDAKLLGASSEVDENQNLLPFLKDGVEKRKLQSVEILKDVGRLLFFFLPRTVSFPVFVGTDFEDGMDYPDVAQAYQTEHLSVSPWQDNKGVVILTAALPIFSNGNMIGVVYLVASGEEMFQAMGDAWFDIFKIFLFSLFSTIFISIYLSGVISRPLKNLANAAERVRKGKLKYTDIPDLSDRNDEIGDLSVVLREMMQALWERMDAIESFAADVSHEIKNPLTSLKSAVETISIVKKNEDKEKLLEIIRHDIDRLDRLITDISSASKLDAELSRENFSLIDMRTLIRNLLDVYKNPLERAQSAQGNALTGHALKDGVIIEMKLPKDDCIVLGSEGRLNQVFQNIISNALSFSPLKSKITIVVTKKANTVNIAIEDGGPGIPENKLDSVFDRFYSERPQHEDYGRHSGLGLSICKQIVQAHGGVIYAENVKDRAKNIKGARFVVILSAV